MRSFIWAQLDTQSQELDSWDKVVEITVNAEAKASLQLYSKIREMDSKCLQGKQLIKTNDFSKPKEKNKSTYILFTNWGGNQILHKMLDWSPGKKDSGPHRSSCQDFRG